MSLDPQVAQRWLSRWDRQQEYYVPDREERFATLGDILEHVAGDSAHILDLGCGPGSLSVRLADRMHGTNVIGVDNDPLLLELGRTVYSERVRFVLADLSNPHWYTKLDLPGPADAAVSTTALHWMSADSLEALYKSLASLIRPGGMFLNADHLSLDSPRMTELATMVRARRAYRAGVSEREDWEDWWAAVSRDPQLSPLLENGPERVHHGDNGVPVHRHREMLHAAGFEDTGVLWQVGDDQILVARR